MVDIADTCEAEVNDIMDAIGTSMGWVACHLTVGHDGDHKHVTQLFCPQCGGLELHHEWCPDMDQVSNDLLIITFDDDGWCWVAPEDAKEFPPAYGNKPGWPFE
jgi:hypothetical protein